MNCNELSFLFCFLFSCINSLLCEKPHIILIVASDLGFGDVGYHGTSEIPTPNIDALAYSGIMLRNYYVNTFSSHSRSALMTGKYPLYRGWQRDVSAINPIGLPLNERILPEYLKIIGYKNRIVGKWHLGYRGMEETPLFRGFDSHLGSWTGHQDYYDHTNTQEGYWGFDMRRNFEIAYDLHGKHATDIYTDEAIKIIENHDMNAPLFLYVAHTAVQQGSHYNPLPWTIEEDTKFRYIESPERRKYAILLSKLDKSVGCITHALQKKGMLENSIIIFTGDNGGPCRDNSSNGASNYPFRGCKGTLWEGGLRTPAFIWSKKLLKRRGIFDMEMHIMDWLPTLLDAVEPKLKKNYESTLWNFPYMNGVSMWNSFLNDAVRQRAATFLGIIYDEDNFHLMAALSTTDYKVLLPGNHTKSLVEGRHKWITNPYNQRTYNYDAELVTYSLAGKALKRINNLMEKNSLLYYKTKLQIECNYSTYLTNTTEYTSSCDTANQLCSFALQKDPCENYDLIENNATNKMLDIKLISNLLRVTSKIVQSLTEPDEDEKIDGKSHPRYWNYVYENFKGTFIPKSVILFLYVDIPMLWENGTINNWLLVLATASQFLVIFLICTICLSNQTGCHQHSLPEIVDEDSILMGTVIVHGKAKMYYQANVIYHMEPVEWYDPKQTESDSYELIERESVRKAIGAKRRRN